MQSLDCRNLLDWSNSNMWVSAPRPRTLHKQPPFLAFAVLRISHRQEIAQQSDPLPHAESRGVSQPCRDRRSESSRYTCHGIPKASPPLIAVRALRGTFRKQLHLYSSDRMRLLSLRFHPQQLPL